MKPVPMMMLIIAVLLTIAACTPNHNFPTQGQGYPDDPKAGEPTESAP